MHGPPAKNNIFEYYEAYSKIMLPIFNAAPLALNSLYPDGTSQGSTYKSSNIELKENSHSLSGTKNLLMISVLLVICNISIICYG